MEEKPGYSLRIGRVRGVDLRIHSLFFLFALVGWMGSDRDAAACAFLGALALAAGVHEAARAWMGHQLGVQVRAIALWPLGGLNREEGVSHPEQEFRMAWAGLFSTLLFLGGTVAFAWAGRKTAFATPAVWESAVFKACAALTAWNLLPCFPLDGARLLRPLFWARGGFGVGTRVACGISFLSALFLAAWGFHVAIAHGTFHVLGLSAVLIHQTYREMRRTVDEEEWDGEGWESSGSGPSWREAAAGYESDAPVAPREGWMQRMRRRRREHRGRVLHERVDAILVKISQAGMESLTPRERRFLWNASDKYRHPDDP